MEYIRSNGETASLDSVPQNRFPSGRQLIEVGFEAAPAQLFLGFRSRVMALIDEMEGSLYFSILPPDDPHVIALQEQDPDPGKGDSRDVIPFPELMPKVA